MDTPDRSGTAARRAHLSVVALSVGLVLAGCTAPVAPPTMRAAVTSTPTPTPSQPSIPQSRLPLDCRDLADASVVGAHYKGDMVAVAVDETATARGFAYRALQQGGGLHCVWGGSGRTDGGYDLGMELFVLTDAASAYEKYAGTTPPNLTWVANRYGHSKSYCYIYEGFLQCYGDVLVGRTWLDFRLTDDHHPMTTDQAYTWADEQIYPVLAAMSRAGALRPAWNPPPAFDTRRLCDAATASAIADAPVTVANRADPSDYPTDVGAAQVATAQCTWTSSAPDADVRIAGLTGGAWALPGMTANLAETPGILGGAAQPVTVPGADGAFVADGELAWGAVVTEGSLIEVFRDSSQNGSDNVPLMTRITAYIDAHS